MLLRIGDNAAMTNLAPHPGQRPSCWSHLLLVAAYLLLYVLLDWVSYIRPLQGFNITPWNPQPALAIALLLWSRQRLWLVWLGLLTAEFVVRGVPDNGWSVLTASLAQSWIFAGLALALTRTLGPRPDIGTLRNLAWFTGIAALGALLSAVTYVAAYAAPDLGTAGAIGEAIARYWVGDLVGLLVTLPMFLILIDAQRRRALFATLRSPYWLLFIALIGLLLWALLGHGGGIYLRFFYLLFIPIVFASTRLGTLGAVLAASLTQPALIVAVQTYPQPDLAVFELQLLMAAITMTGLLVGVLVDERSRTAEALRETMRLATAGQMAAALAHELSQPLTALNNYAQACQLLVQDAHGLDPQRRAQLDTVTRHIVSDTGRARDVVKRLRDFFRTGALQLQPGALAEVVQAAVAAHRPHAALEGIELRTAVDAALPVTLMDPVQIGIVLRNLIDNGLHAAAASAGPRWVEVSADRTDEHLLVQVRDSGPGIEAARLPQLFEAGSTDKPGGMGIGLGICRAIVEAHGGRLWVPAAGQGHFCFTLPLAERPA
jgi:signal transduction histidine kinase